MLLFSNTNIDAIQFNGQNIDSIFVGSELVYSSSSDIKLINHGAYCTLDDRIPTSLFEYLKFKHSDDNGLFTLRHTYNSTTVDVPVEYLDYKNNTVFSSNTNLGNATTDGNIVMARFRKNLTISNNATLSTSVRKKGLFIYVDGDLNLTGHISMTARGASATGQNLALVYDGSTLYYVPAVGASGGAKVSTTGTSGGQSSDGKIGGHGTNGQTGGGGSGGSSTNWSGTYVSGAGGKGTSYSGGSGGGGAYGYLYSHSAQDGSSTGGAGGNAKFSFGYSIAQGATGGAGNSGGLGMGGGTGDMYSPFNGKSGTGGLLCVFVKGNITINASSSLQANGVLNTIASTSSITVQANGGSSGGGSVNVFYGGAITNSGSIIANGGGVGGSSGIKGGAGGNGTARAIKINNW